MTRQLTAAARLSLVVAAVAALSWVDFAVIHLNSATAAFTFLLLILGLATKIGRAESVIASLASMLAYDLCFLPPIGKLTLAGPQNVITLLAFFVTAVITSQLSSTIRAQADEAAAGRQQIQRLYDFSRGLMLTDDPSNVVQRAALHLTTEFKATGACVYAAATGTLGVAGEASLFTREIMRRVSDTGEPWFNEDRQAIVAPIRFAGRPLGSLGVSGAPGATEVGLYALAQLVAGEMERAVAQEVAARMQAAREGEQLKAVLLDALAHDFKTPLTSIKAAAGTMLGAPHLPHPVPEMASVIDEEADRLNVLVSDAIEVARLGAGPVHLQPVALEVREVISTALQVLANRLEDRVVAVNCAADLPLISADRKLAELALRQLLMNALLYSEPGSPIELRARAMDNAVALMVGNEGAPIPHDEQRLIFEKFYRGASVRRRVAGSGMGLSIARDIIVAHGGKIWLERDGKHPVEFWFTLPRA